MRTIAMFEAVDGTVFRNDVECMQYELNNYSEALLEIQFYDEDLKLIEFNSMDQFKELVENSFAMVIYTDIQIDLIHDLIRSHKFGWNLRNRPIECSEPGVYTVSYLHQEEILYEGSVVKYHKHNNKSRVHTKKEIEALVKLNHMTAMGYPWIELEKAEAYDKAEREYRQLDHFEGFDFLVKNGGTK